MYIEKIFMGMQILKVSFYCNFQFQVKVSERVWRLKERIVIFQCQEGRERGFLGMWVFLKQSYSIWSLLVGGFFWNLGRRRRRNSRVWLQFGFFIGIIRVVFRLYRFYIFQIWICCFYRFLGIWSFAMFRVQFSVRVGFYNRY